MDLQCLFAAIAYFPAINALSDGTTSPAHQEAAARW
jgi:hypothetical protein